jgi:DNA/RNA-binding domain of Phe-tRNA-synthetase-like protein
LVLRDEKGIFGNPTADSARTMIEKNTSRILVLFFIPPEVPDTLVLQTLDYLKNLYSTDCPQSDLHTELVYSIS